MRDKLKPRRPSLGTVLGLTALVVAVVGTAHAAPSRVIVRKGDIAPGAVTAKALAKGAVHSKAIAKSAVTARKLAKGSVGTEALATDAVTAQQLAPGSVYAGALGAETIVTKPITDLDAIAHNGEWTESNAETALCGPGEKLLGPGFAFTNSGNHQAGWLEALPIINGETNGVTGRITSDSGGTATAEIAALCLK